MAALIDEEVKALVDGAYARCGEILTHRRRELDIVAEYLLQYENMDAKTFEQVFTDRRRSSPRRPIRLWRPRRSRTPARRRSMAQIECVLGDITRIEVDAIVNAANRTLLGGRRCGRSHPPGGRPGAVGRVPYPPRL